MDEQLLGLWPTQASVQACIKQEAEAIDEAVFLAVHQPMRFQRRDVGASGATLSRAEEHLLEEFLTPNLSEGRLILPIVGNSGVGKSHVIRWLDAQLRRRPDAKRYHIIRVPKGSSLKGVLRLLLFDLQGPAFDRLREALVTARDHLDTEMAARELQLRLRLRLQREAESAGQRVLNGAERANDREVQAFGDPRMLPALLGDPILEQKHWLTRGDGAAGVLTLMAQQVTQDSRAHTDGRRHQFVAADLVLSDAIDVADLSSQARNFYAKIHRGDPERREQAVRVLNLVLDDAKNDLLQLGDNSLVELFADVRVELGRLGMELVFLVEDFAVLSGLQGALLQVMIAEATRDGVQRLCTMRTALAYTEGYMAGRDTVLTRARSEWVLEDRPGDDGEILRRVERLVGAYLNAARVGQGPLQLAYGNGVGVGLRDWVPRGDQVDLTPAAQAAVDTFGKSEDGYPLFPFSAAAVRQLTRRGSLDSRGELIFNPRHVINNLLTRVLVERPAFVKGAFPPAHLGADELRSAEVTVDLGRRVPTAELSRYQALLRLWGDQPESTVEAAMLPAAVYESFGLKPVDFGVAPPPARQEVRRVDGPARDAIDEPPPAPRGSKLTAAQQQKERRWREALEAWALGETLGQAEARELRGWIADALDAYLPADALLLRLRTTSRQHIKQIYLPRAKGQGDVTPVSAFVVVAGDEVLQDTRERARLVQTLLAFARRYDVHLSWDYDDAEVDGGLVHDFLELRAATAVEYLRQRHFQVEAATLPSLVRGLMVGARALGIPGVNDRSGTTDLLQGLLADASETAEGGSGPWAEIQQSFAQTRAKWREMLLEQVAARQGGARAVYAVDAAALAPLIEAVTLNWGLGSPPPQSTNDPDYRDFVSRFNDLRIGIERAINEEQRAILDWLPEAVAWFGEEFDKAGIQTALRGLVTDVKNRGLVPQADYGQLRADLSGLTGVALISLRDAATRLAAQPSRGEVLTLLAAGPGRALGPAKQFVSRMDGFLVDLERALAGREAAIAGDIVQSAVTAVTAELTTLETILARIEDARL